MSTEARSWWGKLPRGWRWVATVWLLWPVLTLGQSRGWPDGNAAQHPIPTEKKAVSMGHPILSGEPAPQDKARAVVGAVIQALGGQRWLALRTIRVKGRAAAFYQGTPTGRGSDVTITTELPDEQRVDAEGGRVVQIYAGREAWEITYQGKRKLPAAQSEDFLRRHDHSLGVVLRRWVNDPTTVLIDDGPSQVERRPAEKITVINSANEAVTLEVDAESHFPLRLSFEWRDPRFRDKTLDAVEYDNYHRIDGISTAFTVTEMQDGEVVRERYLQSAEYDVSLPKDFFDPDVAARHLK